MAKSRTTPKGRVPTRHSGGKLASERQGNAVGGEPVPARDSRPLAKTELHGLGKGAAPDKYETLTVYDPAAKAVRHPDGRAVAVVPVTLAQLSELPGTLAMLDRLYECEPADEKTVRLLAKSAGCSVSALEDKRRAWVEAPANCPPQVRENRRRCWRCPRWRDTDATRTPFD